jgi:hypothetical protein
LIDDRQYQGGYRKLIDEMTPHVARLKAKHAWRNPKHYTIADNPTPRPAILDVLLGHLQRNAELRKAVLTKEHLATGGVVPREIVADALDLMAAEQEGLDSR